MATQRDLRRLGGVSCRASCFQGPSLLCENPFGLWPYHLHGLIRFTVRGVDDAAVSRRSPVSGGAIGSQTESPM